MSKINKKFVPMYGGKVGGKMSNGSGWGGEMPAMNPSIKTKSKKNSMGEIINPTKKDVAEYNKKYKTIRLPANIKVRK